MHVLYQSSSVLLRKENVSDKSCRQNHNKHFMFNNFFNCAIYEIMRNNITEPDRRQMQTACWIPKARNTHSEYVILIAFPLQQWLRKRASMLRHQQTARHVKTKH